MCLYVCISILCLGMWVEIVFFGMRSAVKLSVCLVCVLRSVHDNYGASLIWRFDDNLQFSSCCRAWIFPLLRLFMSLWVWRALIRV